MTKEEAIKALNAIEGGEDCFRDEAHSEADKILLLCLRDNGFMEVAEAWKALDKRCHGFYYA